MTTRNTLKLKELIYDTLTADAPLEVLLGGAGRIREGSPEQLSEYPLVTYNILTDVDNPFDADQPMNAVNTILMIECFSNITDSAEVDAIEDRVYEILNGQRLSNSYVQMYSIYRDSKSQLYESEINVWHIVSSYKAYNSTL